MHRVLWLAVATLFMTTGACGSKSKKGGDSKDMSPAEYCKKLSKIFKSESKAKDVDGCIKHAKRMKKENPKRFACTVGCATSHSDRKDFFKCAFPCRKFKGKAPKFSPEEMAKYRAKRKARVEHRLSACVKSCKGHSDNKAKLRCLKGCTKRYQQGLNAL